MNSDTEPAVAQTLKMLDRDRYFASLVLPADKRLAIQSLWAMSAEIAATRERVSEPAPGEIRLQFWTDLLAGTPHGSVLQSPIAAAVLDTIARFKLETGPLQRLIAARRFDLYDDPMPDMETFEGYAGETHSVLFQYAATILNDGEAPSSGDAAGHLGVAQALLGHMRAFGFNAARGRLVLPLTVFTAHGVSERELFSGTATPALHAAFVQLRETAANHLGKARSAVAAQPKTLRPAFAQMALLDAESRHLRGSHADPYRPDLPQADWRKLGHLIIWSLRQR